MHRLAKFALLTFAVGLLAISASASCELNDGKIVTKFEATSLDGLMVEKKSMIELDKEFPSLNVIEKAFSGAIQTCSSCTGRFITCKAN